MTIRIDDVHSIKLIMQACRVQFVPGLHHAIADYDRHDRIKGGVLYTNYTDPGGSLEMHIAGFQKNWGSKGLLWLAFDYPFNQVGVKKVFGLVPEWNAVARGFDVHLGFKIEYLTRDVFNRPDGVNGMYLLSMTRDECIWLNMKIPPIELAERSSAVAAAVNLLQMPTVSTIH